jgi:hypothetical protein
MLTTERAVRMLAGLFVLVTLVLGAPQSPLFVSTKVLWLTAFVGANLLQSALTGFCPAEPLLRRLGTRDAAATVPPTPR